jgi:hypothetical protein
MEKLAKVALSFLMMVGIDEKEKIKAFL